MHEYGARKTFYHGLFAIVLFCACYVLMNHRLIVESILYRLASNDHITPIYSISAFSIQAIALLIGLAFLSPRWFLLFFTLSGVSAFMNNVYSRILHENINVSSMSWLASESRQAGNAIGEFIDAIIISGLIVFLSLLLLSAARKFIRPAAMIALNRASVTERKLLPLLLFIVLCPSVILPLSGLGPVAAERNVYGYVVQILLADSPPPRRTVVASPHAAKQLEKIVWLIDESVNYTSFSKIILPEIQELHPVDFGEAMSLANCSSPANLALRSGVDVRRIDSATDLRRMPSIWAYARKAGYKPILFDGQVSGPPQNMMTSTELALIETYESLKSGLRTDLDIAGKLNRHLRSPGKEFIYVVLRGVHFQYKDHYPKSAIPSNSTLSAQYEQAIAYSKKDFFSTLLSEVDREKVAIIYTSDHGQNVREGVTPHCSVAPVRDEFSVPLLAFLPSTDTRQYQSPGGGRSASQIFPTTLQWMGYSRAYARAHYDEDLKGRTAQYVWFGRNVIPVNRGDPIELYRERGFPKTVASNGGVAG